MENLREGISPTPGQKIVYKIASFYLFSLTLVLALGSWFLLGFSINYGLAFTSWGISQSVLAGFLAFFGIIFTCTLLFCWRRGYFGIDLSKETFKIPPIK
ncbi:hypothetical protein FJZ41_01575 [Candidatus Shapirobacteria bacterium]|nr:hypothetical protein [Candidatus Shapirobacteria bacterium]